MRSGWRRGKNKIIEYSYEEENFRKIYDCHAADRSNSHAGEELLGNADKDQKGYGKRKLYQRTRENCRYVVPTIAHELWTWNLQQELEVGQSWPTSSAPRLNEVANPDVQSVMEFVKRTEKYSNTHESFFQAFWKLDHSKWIFSTTNRSQI